MSEESALCNTIKGIKISDEKIEFVKMDKNERIRRLYEDLESQWIKHEDCIMEMETLKDAHVYCVIHHLSAQQFGPLLEKFIKQKFHFIKNKASEAMGDCCKDGRNLEIKVSLGGSKHNKFNFVQIRPSHKCDYILTAYHLSKENIENEGELYIFQLNSDEMKNIILHFGGYAHGTLKEHGIITIESLHDETNLKEYAIRPLLNDECWKSLLPFRILESSL